MKSEIKDDTAQKSAITFDKVLLIICAVIAVVVVLTFSGLLVGSLISRFSPLPTEYPDTEWVSADGAIRLSVGDYDAETYQCEAVLTVDNTDSVYTVADTGNGTLAIIATDGSVADHWLRVKCSKSGFIVRVNHSGTGFIKDYPENGKLEFTREE